MTKNKEKHIEVYADWVELNGPILMGILHVTPSRGKELFSFSYDKEWLKRKQAHVLDPALQLFQGRQYAPAEQENFGIFLDSSPDRWGRFLMNRREAQQAREAGRKEKKLLESDYLLGVYDLQRMGGLRFRTEPNGPFLDNNQTQASPPWANLRELEQACLAIEKDENNHNPEFSKWLQMLIVPGSSLGGARPKASVVDEKKQLWIAKFPSGQDDHDVGAWEMVVHNLAKQAKIVTPVAKLGRFSSRHHTFLSKRFDRNEKGERIHFSSAMTLLQHSDGDDASSGASYLELAECILRIGADPVKDLEQLWRRIVFFVCVSNVDDHLRNHGFILTPTGWLLAPAYDMNPVARGNGLKLNISETDNAQDLGLAREVAEHFRLSLKRADEIINEVKTAVQTWSKEAKALGLSPKEQEQMASSFSLSL
jgi:serine/threonine-protein kinase HipA